MMPTRQQQLHALDNPVLLDQIAGSLLMYAIGVLSEDPSTPQHTARIAYAQTVVITDPRNTAITYIYPFLRIAPLITEKAGSTNGTDGSSCSDTDIDALISQNFDVFRKMSGYPDEVLPVDPPQ